MMQHRLYLSGLTFLLIALTACVPFEEAKPDKKNAEYHYSLGFAALSEQNPTDALKEFLKAEKYDSRDPEIQAGLAQAYWSKRAYALAEEHYKNALKLSKYDPKYYNNLAALYLSMERYDEAIEAFRTAADNLLFDRSELAWTGIGLANYHKQDYPAAEYAYRKAIELNPRYYLAPFHLGELYFNLDRPVEALDMFSRTVELAPGFPNGHYWQGLVYMKMKDTEKAEHSFMEVIRLAPQSETARLARNYLKILDK
ncbi:MAG: tetratricopeptide repeat protein [Desulfuromonadales bacterium]